MNVEITKLPESRVALKINLSAEEVDQALDRTYKQLVQRVNVPGFRKGRAPRQVVERMVGHEFFLHEATEEAIRWGYRKAVDQENLTPIDEAEIQAHENSDKRDHNESHLNPGQPFDFEATVAVKPEVELPDYRAFRVEREVEEVTDEDVDALVQDIRERNTTLEPTIRPAQLGDVISMSIAAKVGGEEIINTENGDFEIRDEEESGPDPVLPGLSHELEGVNRGDIREIALELPQTYANEDIAGKTMFLRILVKEIKRKVLPHADDDLAKSVSEFQTLDELRDALRQNLDLERKMEADEKLVQRAIEEVTSRTFIDIPPILVEEELDRMTDDLRQTFERQGMSFQAYLDMTGKSDTEIRNELREGAIQNVKTSLVLGAVADAEGVEVTNAQITAALEDLLRTVNVSSAERREMRSSTSVRANLRSRIRRQRAIRKLVEIMSDGEEVASEATDAVADQTAGTAEDAEETVAVEVGG